MGTAKSEVVLISPEAPPKQENFYTQPKFIQPPEVEIQEEDKSVDFKCVPEGETFFEDEKRIGVQSTFRFWRMERSGEVTKCRKWGKS